MKNGLIWLGKFYGILVLATAVFASTTAPFYVYRSGSVNASSMIFVLFLLGRDHDLSHVL